MDGENGIIREITMEKNKNFLIFTNNLFPYKISFDLNTGKYHKITNNKTKEIKCIKPFFANCYYRHIINKDQFPIYYRIIEMARDLSDYSSYISNMGSVLDLLRTHMFWEQYLTLGIPVTRDMDYPLTFFPKDVLSTINRAIKLNEIYKHEKYPNSRWYDPYKYVLPDAFNKQISRMCDYSNILFNAIRYISQFEDDRDFMQRFSFIYGEYEKFVELVKTYNYEYKTLIEYLCYLQDYDGYDYRSSIMNDLCDYNAMSSKIAKVCDRKGKYEKYPHFLKSRHMIVTKNYNIMEQDHKEEFFSAAYNGSLEYSDRKYVIIEPKSSKDILREASEMHNCVASYIDKIIEGRTHIVFMREKENIDDSLVTVEVKLGHLCQAYQKNNNRISQEQLEFLQKYAKNKKIVLDNL